MLQFFLDNLEDKNDINVLDHIHATPAHDAAEFGQQETLLMLLKHGANISIKDTVSVPLVQTQHMLIIIHCVQFIESAMYTCIMGTKLKERE